MFNKGVEQTFLMADDKGSAGPRPPAGAKPKTKTLPTLVLTDLLNRFNLSQVDDKIYIWCIYMSLYPDLGRGKILPPVPATAGTKSIGGLYDYHMAGHSDNRYFRTVFSDFLGEKRSNAPFINQKYNSVENGRLLNPTNYNIDACARHQKTVISTKCISTFYKQPQKNRVWPTSANGPVCGPEARKPKRTNNNFVNIIDFFATFA
uniref:Uncharacterized protein n=1 Tax=Romanomermis culicivorax TaxID=13658 RepID=A0A915LAN5_ROMCU